MEVDLTSGSQMIYIIPEIMMTIGDFYRNIQISILTRGYEAWQNSEVNLLITRGLVGRLSNTHNVGFAYEIQEVVDYLTSQGVNALPGRNFSTMSLQGLNWVINPTQVTIPIQPSEVNSQTMMDGRISLSFSNYAAAQTSEQPVYNNKDEEVQEILAVLIETKPGVFTNYNGIAEEYYEEYGDMEDYFKGEKFDYYVNYDIPKAPPNLELPPPSWDEEVMKKLATPNERYSSTAEPHILVNKISQHVVLPQRHTERSAGLDISASHAAVIEPYGRDLVHTGLQIEIPYGYYGRLASRSGLAWKNGIEVGAGVIDSDYRGEVKILLFNRTDILVYISPQQKISQLILEKIAFPEVYEVPHLSYSERGDKGFGSTNTRAVTPKPAQIQASNSQHPRNLTTKEIFSLLMPREAAAVLVQDDSIQNNSKQD
ncbi:hypothetical protein ZIOFF_045752 [Zingiber officinale]|uniref:dUTP diphosphatase n=1 Tax=Zingiber officinale TaxID=94328 RepID=A0A8J5L1L4_ZINOF|nr:hypothetical protein ZIOFF_045752 [Zingiber officinale]